MSANDSGLEDAATPTKPGKHHKRLASDFSGFKLPACEYQAILARRVRLRREADARLPRQRLVSHLHRLGPSPLGHFLREIEAGANVAERLDRYARLDPDFVRALGGDRFAPIVRLIDGE